ncbi:MAG: glycosyltransferase family 2 protein [Acidobacteriota bacterium]|nr:glycosyltransferase family 2 protein [Acidobacteriota bacterium]
MHIDAVLLDALNIPLKRKTVGSKVRELEEQRSCSHDESSNLFIVVPVLNEAPNLKRLMASFRQLVAEFGEQHRLQFILVNDGSTDGTETVAGQLADGLDLVILSHPTNMGPGYAFGTAFEYMAPRLRATDWVVTMEGDNTSRHELLRQMLIRTQEGYEVVLASPYMYGGGIVQTTAWRIFLSHIANTFIKEFLGIHGILTMSSFYRLHRGEVITKLQMLYGPRIIERQGFESMIEMLLKMLYLQTKISEVPMLLDTSRRIGKSKMKILRTVVGYLGLWKSKRRWQEASSEV